MFVLGGGGKGSLIRSSLIFSPKLLKFTFLIKITIQNIRFKLQMYCIPRLVSSKFKNKAITSVADH